MQAARGLCVQWLQSSVCAAHFSGCLSTAGDSLLTASDCRASMACSMLRASTVTQHTAHSTARQSMQSACILQGGLHCCHFCVQPNHHTAANQPILCPLSTHTLAL